MDGTKTTTNWIIAGLVALVVIIGGGWLIARERSGAMLADTTSSIATTTSTGEAAPAAEASPATAATPTPAPRPSTVDETASASGETITVIDQSAGGNVIVADVNINKPSFVAVRDTRGWYPGWQFVSASEKSVVIPLKRNTEAGQTYEVVIFVDDGDGSLEIHGGDAMLVSTQGAPVSSTFTAK